MVTWTSGLAGVRLVLEGHEGLLRGYAQTFMDTWGRKMPRAPPVVRRIPCTESELESASTSAVTAASGGSPSQPSHLPMAPHEASPEGMQETRDTSWPSRSWMKETFAWHGAVVTSTILRIGPERVQHLPVGLRLGDAESGEPDRHLHPFLGRIGDQAQLGLLRQRGDGLHALRHREWTDDHGGKERGDPEGQGPGDQPGTTDRVGPLPFAHGSSCCVREMGWGRWGWAIGPGREACQNFSPFASRMWLPTGRIRVHMVQKYSARPAT